MRDDVYGNGTNGSLVINVEMISTNFMNNFKNI